jgi:hypothetical protein
MLRRVTGTATPAPDKLPQWNGAHMPTLQDRIAAKFIETLEQSDAVSETQAKQIQGLLASGKTVKPDDIVAALKALESDGVK